MEGGFAEAGLESLLLPESPNATLPAPAPRPAQPFASTGPQGHRARMRARLLANPDALADYELLEMLLFLGIPRRDTKPQAKAAINRFGSLSAVLAASPRVLHESTGLRAGGIAALKLVEAATQRLGAAERIERPVLNRWDRLTAYLDANPGGAEGTLRLLFLDNRNRLLADEPHPLATGAAVPAWLRTVLCRALALHATALLVVQDGIGIAAAGEPAALSQRLRQAGGLLSVVLHDHLVRDGADWASLRREGLLT